jgi:hypothetical protein
MGGGVQGKAPRVYKDCSPAKVIVFLLFSVALVGGRPACTLLPAISAGGVTVHFGRHLGGYTTSDPGTWAPASLLVPCSLAVAMVLIGLVALVLLIHLKSKIVMDDERVWKVDFRGNDCFRVRWEQITGVSEDVKGNTLVSAGPTVMKIDKNLPSVGALLVEIKNRTGRAPR